MTTSETTGKVELDITGMTCASCANRVERRLNEVPGVTASVNFATEKASVERPGSITDDELVAVVAAAGYTAAVPQPGPRDEVDEARPLQVRLLVSAALTLPVLLLGMVPAWQFSGWEWVSLVLATPVVLWAAWPFHAATLNNLRHGATTMDTLVSIGVLSAFGWSAYVVVSGSAGTCTSRRPPW